MRTQISLNDAIVFLDQHKPRKDSWRKEKKIAVFKDGIRLEFHPSSLFSSVAMARAKIRKEIWVEKEPGNKLIDELINQGIIEIKEI